MEILTKNSLQTKKLGEILAREILKTKNKKIAFIICLEGDLGGGKTTFLKGLAKGFKIRAKVLSPTFVLFKKFQIPKGTQPRAGRGVGGFGSKFQNFYHLDCYRIEKPKEILDLGFKRIISNPKNIVAIEWADRLRRVIPKEAFWIKFEILNKNQRKIMLNY